MWIWTTADRTQALKVICKDHQAKSAPVATQGRSSNSVSAEVDRLLSPKSLKELEDLEGQISVKLQSDEPIDVEYWEQLLRNVAVYKAKAELDAVYKTIIESRLNDLRQEQRGQAEQAKEKLRLVLDNGERQGDGVIGRLDEDNGAPPTGTTALQYSRRLDPEPLLKLRAEDKCLDILDENAFMDKIVSLSYDPVNICDI